MVHPLGDLNRTAKLAKRAESIQTRDDLNRWAVRSRKRLRFLLIAYLWGALPVVLLMVYFTVASAVKGDTVLLNGILFSMVPGFCCFGPIVLLPCYVLLSNGLGNYKKTLSMLREQQRVCAVCDAVALFDDEYVNPRKSKGHTTAKLIPHMNAINEGDEVSVLCDKCLAEVNALDSDQ
jgi:hypothetical protein